MKKTILFKWGFELSYVHKNKTFSSSDNRTEQLKKIKKLYFQFSILHLVLKDTLTSTHPYQLREWIEVNTEETRTYIYVKEYTIDNNVSFIFVLTHINDNTNRI